MEQGIQFERCMIQKNVNVEYKNDIKVELGDKSKIKGWILSNQCTYKKGVW